MAGSALTAPCWCWDENKEQGAAFLEAWTHSTWQDNLVFFSPKSLASGTVMFALDSARMAELVFSHSGHWCFLPGLAAHPVWVVRVSSWPLRLL